MKRATMSTLLALIVLLCGCRTIPDQYWPLRPSEDPKNPIPRNGVRVIQINEGSAQTNTGPMIPGIYFKSYEHDTLMDWLNADPGMPIVLFVHGWHHNAKESDENLVHFRSFIALLGADICTLSKPLALSGYCSGVKGVYVGWRGDSQDPIIFRNTLDFPTIYDRKAASVRVGLGDLKKLIEVIESTFPDRDVVVVGHSLGASAVYQAIRERGGFAVASRNGVVGVAERHDYILINPAISASEFNGLAQQLERREDQQMAVIRGSGEIKAESAATFRIRNRLHRKVLIIQASSDKAMGKLYPIAEHDIGVGFDEQWRNYTAKVKPGPQRESPSITNRHRTDYCKIELESGLVLNDAKGSDTQSLCYEDFSNPVWSVFADPDVSSGHSDIFNAIQRRSLAELIAKRMLRIEDL